MINHIMINDLLEGGEKILTFSYSKWCHGIMLLLPTREEDKEINESVLRSVNNSISRYVLFEQYISKHRHSPFLIETDVNSITDELGARLARYRGDWHRLKMDEKIFNDWRKVVYKCDNDESGEMLANIATHHWEYYVEEESK